MADEIRPALTPEEWAEVAINDQTTTARTLQPLSSGGLFRRIQVWRPEAFQVMALANAALPDDDPRKITRERLRGLTEVVRRQWPGPTQERQAEEMLALLAALLPPDA